MTFDEYKSHCLSKQGAEETYPFGDHAVWFKIAGKAFSWTFVKPYNIDGREEKPFSFTNLKCDPDKAIQLREQYDAVKPGWHQSKKHWNSVHVDGSLSNNIIKELIDDSYDIVLSSLSKKQRKNLETL